jgi:hypothetical protein
MPKNLPCEEVLDSAAALTDAQFVSAISLRRGVSEILDEIKMHGSLLEGLS